VDNHEGANMGSISSQILNRLSGFSMIVNTLLPALLVLLVSIGFAFFVPNYLEGIRDAAQNMQTAANDAKIAAGEVATNVQAHAKAAQGRLKGITKKIEKTNETISEGISKVPVKRVREGVAAAFDVVFDPLSPVADLAGDFKSIGDEIHKLDKLKTHFDEFAANAKKVYEYLRDLMSFFDTWGVLLWATLIIVVSWIALSYVLWGYRRLTIGLALMRGSDHLMVRTYRRY